MNCPFSFLSHPYHLTNILTIKSNRHSPTIITLACGLLSNRAVATGFNFFPSPKRPNRLCGPLILPFNGVPGAFSPGIKQPWREAYHHLYLVPGSRNMEQYLHTIIHLHGADRNNLTCTTVLTPATVSSSPVPYQLHQIVPSSRILRPLRPISVQVPEYERTRNTSRASPRVQADGDKAVVLRDRIKGQGVF